MIGKRKFTRAFQGLFWILLHTVAVVGPLLAFTSTLLGLVYLNYWDKKSDRPADLQLNSGFYSDILYVDYSATRLILVASWSSSVAIPLIGSLLTLISYPVAAHMLFASRRSLTVLLPSPRQLGLLIELLDGRKTALLTWLADLWSHRASRVPSRWIIELPVGIQLIGIVLR